MYEDEISSNNDENMLEEEAEEALSEVSEEAEEVQPSEKKEDELMALRNELALLKSQLSENRAVYDRLSADCSEFSELYPDVALSSIPDSVWASVKNGVPLAAAYALSERRAELALAKAEDVNSKNKSLSSGTLGKAGGGEYFSPAEVRAMSPAEVRANYSKIINSMSKWH